MFWILGDQRVGKINDSLIAHQHHLSLDFANVLYFAFQFQVIYVIVGKPTNLLPGNVGLKWLFVLEYLDIPIAAHDSLAIVTKHVEPYYVGGEIDGNAAPTVTP